MKKRMTALFLAGVLAVTLLLGGCTSKAEKKALEYKELAISQMDKGEYQQAAENFQKALDQSVGRVGADELDVCYYKALALYKSGDPQGALDVYTSLLDYDEDNWEVYFLRGRLYLTQQQSEEALADFAKASSLREDDVELCVHIYEDLTDAGLAENGKEYYQKVMSIKPAKGEEYYFVGDMYFLNGDYENAKANLQQAKDLGYDKAFLMLGQIYAAEGNSEEAKAAFSSYMEKYPDDAEALNELGAIALAAGEYENALTYLESALDASDGSMDRAIQKNLICAYEYTHDFKSAYNMARQYLKNNSDEEVEREYEFLKTRVAGLNQAEENEMDVIQGQTQEEQAQTDSAGEADAQGE